MCGFVISGSVRVCVLFLVVPPSTQSRGEKGGGAALLILCTRRACWLLAPVECPISVARGGCARQGMEAVGKLTRAQAIIVADQPLCPLGRHAARVAANEAVSGSYDAIERKYCEWASSTFTKAVVFPAAAAVAGTFGTGLLLALWRFVLFGLGPMF